ncbi:hypothetical protein SODALDRAFT_361760 [Sodiomyces alkalinus F11]|uniref:Uncharacterized protein n=1 Tax=Sodiomyces alkalinus (strain CBS 110278 / VKM F-3762 / F11) TaxID=1314773 RepID=A0A3N2PR11_SODAK|nr:hypothetical protein SODALDRAFT_361760 [Sodiomyces alkalinus F11]ROT36925.1 hypothetical protein SODALDRAFT_361760 [Sodiomyces alkalinus F11]
MSIRPLSNVRCLEFPKPWSNDEKFPFLIASKYRAKMAPQRGQTSLAAGAKRKMSSRECRVKCVFGPRSLVNDGDVSPNACFSSVASSSSSPFPSTSWFYVPNKLMRLLEVKTTIQFLFPPKTPVTEYRAHLTPSSYVAEVSYGLLAGKGVLLTVVRGSGLCSV